jgi:CubicO group peptidase (beta-lactamase class C family)
MTRRTTTIILGTAYAVLSLAPHPSEAVSRIPSDVKENVRARVRNKLSSGIVVGVIDETGTSYFSPGTLSFGEKEGLDKNSIFEIGSITKAFTTILLADLVERGVVNLDDPIEKFLPKGVKVPKRGGKTITLEDLATHRSGLPRMPTNFEPKDLTNPFADYTTERLYDFLSGYTLSRDIGATYEYSNLGMGLLGHILALQAGKTYEQLIIERICNPLSLKDTRITLSSDQQERLAKAGGGKNQFAGWDFGCLEGCGAVRSTARDMLQFMAANMNLRKTPLQAAMNRSHQGRFQTLTPKLAVAFGWHVWSRHGPEIIWHNGGTGGYHSFCGFVPGKNLGVVVLANSSLDIDDIGLHILEPQYKLKKVKNQIEVSSDVLDKYVGWYGLSKYVHYHVTRDGNTLFAKLTGQGALPIYPKTETEFFYRAVDAQISFVVGRDGKVESLVLHQNGMNQTFKSLGPDFEPPKRVEISVKPEILKLYVGTYQLTPDMIFTITVEDNKLMAQLTGQPEFQLFGESETEFFYKVVEARITFVKNADGDVTRLILHQHGRDMPAMKIK